MLHNAIQNIYQDAVVIQGNSASDVIAFDANGNQVTIDEAAVQAEITRLQAEYAAKQYQRDRAAAYPSIADQLDKIYHEGIDAWKAQIAAVKNQYPKGGA